MGNNPCRSSETLVDLEERDPYLRIERLMNIEKSSEEAKLNALKMKRKTADV